MVATLFRPFGTLSRPKDRGLSTKSAQTAKCAKSQILRFCFAKSIFRMPCMVSLGAPHPRSTAFRLRRANLVSVAEVVLAPGTSHLRSDLTAQHRQNTQAFLPCAARRLARCLAFCYAKRCALRRGN